MSVSACVWSRHTIPKMYFPDDNMDELDAAFGGDKQRIAEVLERRPSRFSVPELPFALRKSDGVFLSALPGFSIKIEYDGNVEADVRATRKGTRYPIGVVDFELGIPDEFVPCTGGEERVRFPSKFCNALMDKLREQDALADVTIAEYTKPRPLDPLDFPELDVDMSGVESAIEEVDKTLTAILHDTVLIEAVHGLSANLARFADRLPRTTQED